jgi:hypothetical protein
MKLSFSSVLPAMALALFSSVDAWAQEPQTRAEEQRREREEKSRTLTPPKPGGLERALLDLESGRTFERILNPAEGIYPRIGNITTGSGFSLGPGYRYSGLFGGRAVFTGVAAASFTKYWLFDARLQFPELASGRASVEVHGQRYDFPDEDFFGLGPDSSREDRVEYGLRNTIIGGNASFRPIGWLTVTGGVDYLDPRVTAQTEPGRIFSIFGPEDLPGALVQPEFLKYEGGVEFNTRTPRGNPRSGARYAASLQRYEDLDVDRFAFNRFEVDLQQYVPLVRDRRVLALHGLVSFSDADAGAEVPFYLQRTLGGPDDLRGFRVFRFRDRNMLLMQAEYRWEIFTAVDGAIFYDAGKVASRSEDINFRDLETDYGIGFRFGTIKGIFLRVEGAFGSRDGKHFLLRFSNVF